MEVMGTLIGRFNCIDLFGVDIAGVIRALIGRFNCTNLYSVVTPGGDGNINKEV